jgi:hypothetical protein
MILASSSLCEHRLRDGSTVDILVKSNVRRRTRLKGNGLNEWQRDLIGSEGLSGGLFGSERIEHRHRLT